MLLDNRTKEEQVADFLREGIISGRFVRGARLKQAEIAQLLRTSITPVREALKLLEAEGYVAGGSFRGATVSAFDADASLETLNLRVTLESQLVREAITSARVPDLDDLFKLEIEFERAVEIGDSVAVRGINYRFHQRMYAIPNLPQTLHFVQILWARYPFDLINKISGRTGRASEEHRALLQNFVERDVGAAMLATRRHIEAGWAELQTALKAASQH
jgi:DNA-binding GntR family transcriptional regulator